MMVRFLSVFFQDASVLDASAYLVVVIAIRKKNKTKLYFFTYAQPIIYLKS